LAEHEEVMDRDVTGRREFWQTTMKSHQLSQDKRTVASLRKSKVNTLDMHTIEYGLRVERLNIHGWLLRHLMDTERSYDTSS
jgi:hypothetical protein